MNSILIPLQRALQNAGLPVSQRMQGVLSHVTSPRAVLFLRELDLTGSGLGNYLGTGTDKSALYGRRAQATLCLRIYAPDCPAAEDGAQTALEVLLNSPALKLRKICRSPAVFDREADCFAAEMTAVADAWLYAAGDDNSEVLTDFHVKGEWI